MKKVDLLRYALAGTFGAWLGFAAHLTATDLQFWVGLALFGGYGIASYFSDRT